MEFKTRKELVTFLKRLKYFNEGAQGKCYFDRSTNMVYKIFFSFIDEEPSFINREDIMYFSHLQNDTVIWPTDVIYVGQEIVGYTVRYVNAFNLETMDPLSVNLESLERAVVKAQKDIYFLTESSVILYDVLYNILFDYKNLFIIDTMDYGNGKVSEEANMRGINLAIKYFLVSGFFDAFVDRNETLRELYRGKCNALEFLKYFKSELESHLKKEIITLNDAKPLVRRRPNKDYIRQIR